MSVEHGRCKRDIFQVDDYVSIYPECKSGRVENGHQILRDLFEESLSSTVEKREDSTTLANHEFEPVKSVSFPILTEHDVPELIPDEQKQDFLHLFNKIITENKTALFSEDSFDNLLDFILSELQVTKDRSISLGQNIKYFDQGR